MSVHKYVFTVQIYLFITIRWLFFYSSPAVALADSAVFTLLGEENQDKYGSQRMFGSFGWAVTMFIMGMVLDHSKLFQHAKCEMSRGQRNYNVCFFAFATFMFLALLGMVPISLISKSRQRERFKHRELWISQIGTCKNG